MSDSPIRIHLPGLLLLFSFLVALLFYLVWPPSRVARTLFYPSATGTELSGERRLVPRTRDFRRAVELLAEEIVLGPVWIEHAAVLARETPIRSVAIAGKTAYVDLGVEAVLHADRVRLPMADGLAALEKTILYNFRSLEAVVVTVGGNVPFVPAYREASGG